jgi:hypothetical protein
MPALVTGGAGLIGSHIADPLDSGWSVSVLDDLEPQTHRNGKPSWIHATIEFVDADIRDRAATAAALRCATSMLFFMKSLRRTETEESPSRVERGPPFHRIAYCASGHDRDDRVVFEHVRAGSNLLDSLLEEGNVVLAENVAKRLDAGLDADVET